MKNYLSDYNLTAVSAGLKETALNTEQTLDTSMLLPKTAIMSLDPRREDNKDEATGKEEPDTVYDLGALSSFPMPFAKAQAQHFAFGYGFALGSVASSAWGTGRKHLILPTASMDIPGFTAAQRLGQTILKRRLASLCVDDLKATFAKDSWAKLDLGTKGTGKYTDNITEESITAAYNAASLVLAANGVQGSDAATRLDNVHNIKVQVPATLEWADVAFSVVSGATPAVITIAAPGGVATSTTYKVLYVPTEPAWCTFPARVSEPPLRVTNLLLKVGGKWNGTTFLGGHTIGPEVDSIEHNVKNNVAIEYRVGGTGTYASYVQRGGRAQTIGLKQQMRNFLLQQRIKNNEYFGVYAKATGDEFATGYNYYVEVIFPRCNVLKAPISVDGKILAEAGDLVVLQDDVYPSVQVTVGNMVTSYAQ